MIVEKNNYEPWQQNLYIFDFEVVQNDWILVLRKKTTKEFTVFHNDPEAVHDFMMQDGILLAGFNNKHYDQWILKAVMLQMTPEEVKSINDTIIKCGVNGWDILDLRYAPNVPQYDLMDDCQAGISLKAFEAHYGMVITESSVPFDIARPLTEAEVDGMIYYCKKDVEATDILDDLRQDYLRNKVRLGAEKGIAAETALSWTNAKLTSVYLDAKRPVVPWTDERNYVPPKTIRWEYIPQEVIDFFARLNDMSIPDDEVFKEKLEIMVGDCPCVIAYGGIHGAIPNYVEEGA